MNSLEIRTSFLPGSGTPSLVRSACLCTCAGFVVFTRRGDKLWPQQDASSPGSRMPFFEQLQAYADLHLGFFETPPTGTKEPLHRMRRASMPCCRGSHPVHTLERNTGPCCSRHPRLYFFRDHRPPLHKPTKPAQQERTRPHRTPQSPFQQNDDTLYTVEKITAVRWSRGERQWLVRLQGDACRATALFLPCVQEK